MANKNQYTYMNMVEDVRYVLSNLKEIGYGNMVNIDAVTDKLNQFEATLIARNEAAKNKPRKPRTPKAPSEEVMANVAKLRNALEVAKGPMTAKEINEVTGEDWTALQVANLAKRIEGCATSKVVRNTVNSKGLSAEREYTAYSI